MSTNVRFLDLAPTRRTEPASVGPECQDGWMIDATKPGRTLEDYVAFVYQALLNCEGQDIRVQRRHKVRDTRGNIFEIDVYYEFDLAGVRHRVAMECKDWEKRVGRNAVMAFHKTVVDMPSTIGVFSSRSGFQSGAKKYLEDNGVLHFDSNTMPTLGDAVAATIGAAALPSELSVGQPFWSLMEENDGEISGTWIQLPEGADRKRRSQAIFPLFTSRPDVELFMELAQPYTANACVRGIPQSTLRFVISLAQTIPTNFAIMAPTKRRGRTVFTARNVSTRELAERYLSDGGRSLPNLK